MPRDFKTVLCPTDFSDTSYRAVDYGLRFARNASGTLILTHVIHVPAGDLYGRDHMLSFDEATRAVEQRLADLVRTRLEGYPKCQLRVAIGDPAEEIIKIAKDTRADLIITSTHGRSGLVHLVIGSVAEKIIRHAPCPVFVVRSGVD